MRRFAVGYVLLCALAVWAEPPPADMLAERERPPAVMLPGDTLRFRVAAPLADVRDALPTPAEAADVTAAAFSVPAAPPVYAEPAPAAYFGPPAGTFVQPRASWRPFRGIFRGGGRSCGPGGCG